ncbi:MAG: alpha/beta hydrolase [Chloroflexi bacterium]|nr:alpha/beta hydrolase [Chloroflexota bacterium]
MSPTDHYVDLPSGLRAHYLKWPGRDDAPAIVLNHATGFLAHQWAPVAERLAGDYTACAADARGHGDTDKPPPEGDNYHWSRFAEDLRAWLDGLGLRGVPFVGHSAGAASGLYLAAERPEYFTRLVAIEPIVMPGGFHPDESHRNEMSEGARRRRAVFDSAAAAFEHYRSRSLFERWPDEALRLYVEHGTFQREDGRLQLKCPGEIEGEIFANSASLNIWEVLPRIKATVLVIRGEHTEDFLGTVAESVAARLPNGRLETIPGAGHLSPMERPEAVAGLILDFLS